MLRKLGLSVICCLLCMSAYARLGIGAHITPNVATVKSLWGDLDATSIGAELIWETEAEMDALGIRLGLDFMDESKEHYDGSSSSIQGHSDSWIWTIPLTVYYRYKVLPTLHLIGGLGLARATVELESEAYTIWPYSRAHTSGHKNLVYYYMTLGIEWKPWDNFGIGAEARHILGGDRIVTSDLQKLEIEKTSVSASLRFYF